MTKKPDAPAEPTEEAPIGDPPAEGEERLHPILSNAEFLAAQKKARARIESERKKAAIKAVEEAEFERLRKEEGLTPDETVGGEMVNITIDLAPYAPAIILNMTDEYRHGFTYTVPRRVADTLKEICYRSQGHEANINGKTRYEFYQRHRPIEMSGLTGAVKGAPAKFDAEVHAHAR